MSEVSRQEIREVLESALKMASIPFTEKQLEAMVEGYFPAIFAMTRSSKFTVKGASGVNFVFPPEGIGRQCYVVHEVVSINPMGNKLAIISEMEYDRLMAIESKNAGN